MTREVFSLRAGLLLVAMLAVSSTGLLTAQLNTPRASISAYGGIAPNSGGAAILGFELRAFEGRRLAASFTASKWWRAIGCDQLIGIPCDDEAWSADAGMVVSLTQGSGSLAPYASARLGALFYDGLDRRVWDPSLGVGATWSGAGPLGFVMELRYHALMDSKPDNTPHRPSSADYLVFQAGIRLRL
jgi:hypothetical protein